MDKILMQINRKYKLEKIKEIEIGNSNWLTMVSKIKSISIIKVVFILAGIVAFVIFNYWLNEMLFLRDLKLFVKINYPSQ